jgi:TPP-dependent pyruvate/acetoin dehydrogenase alpha subunit
VKVALTRDPILRFENVLREKGILGDALRAEIWKDAEAEMRDAADAAAALPGPPLASMFEDVLATMTPRLRRQCEELNKTIARFGANTDAAGAFPL